MVTVNEGASDEALEVHLENHGPGRALVEQSTLTPRGKGRIFDPDEVMSPVLLEGEDRVFEFKPSEQDKALMAGGHEVHFQVVYLAIGSGLRWGMRARLKRKDDPHEQ